MKGLKKYTHERALQTAAESDEDLSRSHGYAGSEEAICCGPYYI
jgi:hypothetical protein